MSDQKKDPNERGALWEKTGRRGTYFTGMIDGQPVVVFRNDRKKEGSNAPDWRVLKPQKQDRDQDQRVRQTDGVEQVNDDSIPF